MYIIRSLELQVFVSFGDGNQTQVPFEIVRVLNC